MSRRVNIFNVPGPSCTDPDVQAFFAIPDMSEASLSTWLSAIGKTYNEVKTAVCDFVTNIKLEGITGGSNAAMYLPIGNAAAQRKYNFWNPADTNAAFRLTFNGGISFTNFAIVGNGVNGYSDTHFSPIANGSASSMSFAIDSGQNITGGTQVMGVRAGGGFIRMFILFGTSIQIATSTQIIYAGTNKGLFVSRRAASNQNQSYRDGVSLGSSTATFTPPTANFYLNAVNTEGVGAQLFAQHPVNFAFVTGQGWSDAQAVALNTHYQTLKTALGIA
jgi:hypothetical protein